MYRVKATLVNCHIKNFHMLKLENVFTFVFSIFLEVYFFYPVSTSNWIYATFKLLRFQIRL